MLENYSLSSPSVATPNSQALFYDVCFGTHSESLCSFHSIVRTRPSRCALQKQFLNATLRFFTSTRTKPIYLKKLPIATNCK